MDKLDEQKKNLLEIEKLQPKNSLNDSDAGDSRRESHYDEIRHPNMMSDVSTDSHRTKSQANVPISLRQYNKQKKKDCKYFFGKLDYEILRPLLIYKYDKEKFHQQDQFMDIVNNDKDLLQEAYSRINLKEMMKASMVMDNEQNQMERITKVVSQLTKSVLETESNRFRTTTRFSRLGSKNIA